MSWVNGDKLNVKMCLKEKGVDNLLVGFCFLRNLTGCNLFCAAAVRHEYVTNHDWCRSVDQLQMLLLWTGSKGHGEFNF